MLAQIPLTWQLTDLLAALGLGFLYGALYLVLRGLARALAPHRPAKTRAAHRHRRVALLLADGVWAAAGAIFTRAWVLTDSHAAQLRWSMVLGALAGCGIFWLGAAPVLRRQAALVRRCGRALGAALARLLAPLGRALYRLWRRLRRLGLPGRERRRLAYERQSKKRAAAQQAKQQARQQRRQDRLQKRGQTPAAEKNLPETEKSAQKQLQSPQKVLYNNL